MEFITILSASQLANLPLVVALVLGTFVALLGMALLVDLLFLEGQNQALQEVSASADATWDGWYLEDEPEDPPFEGVLELTPAQAIEEATASLAGLDLLLQECHTLSHELDRVFDPARWLQGELALAVVESLYERLALDEDGAGDPGHGPNLEFIGPMTAGGFWLDRNGRVRDARGRFAPKAALKGGWSRVA